MHTGRHLQHYCKCNNILLLQTSALRHNSSSEWTSDGGWIEIQYTAEDHMNDAWLFWEELGNVRYRGRGWLVAATGEHIWHSCNGLQHVVTCCNN